MIYDKHLPRSVREAMNPKLKRDRLDQQKFEQVFSNILRRYGHKLKTRYNIYSADMNDLMDTIEQLLSYEDKQINHDLFNILRGNYTELAREVQKHL